MWEWATVTRNFGRCTLRVVRNLIFVEVGGVRTSGCVMDDGSGHGDGLLGASRAL